MHALSLRFLLIGIAVSFFLLSLSACISLVPDEDETIGALTTLKADSAVVEDTFSLVYHAPKASAKDLAPVAVYTTNFWSPAYFEYASPNIKTISLAKLSDTLWYANIIVPKTAQQISYYISGVGELDSLNTKNYPVLDKKGAPVRAAMYRVAQSYLRSGASTDSVLNVLRAETDRYSDTYDAYILCWSLYYQAKGKTESALTEIESEMNALRKARRGNPDLLQAMALTYIYGIGDKLKANKVLQDSPDSYLHPLNLYNRFATELDVDKRELALNVMAEKYPLNPLTVKMYQQLLYYYVANQKIYAERAALLSEKIWKRNLAALRNSGVVTTALRYLFDYYGKIDLARTMPYVKEVLRMDYDKKIYDVPTLLLFSERFGDSKEYGGLAIDLALKAIQALNTPNSDDLNASDEHDFISVSVENGVAKQDLLGYAYFCIGKAYQKIGDRNNAVSNLQQSLSTNLSKRADIYYELAQAFLEVDKDEAKTYALLSGAFSPALERREWISKTFNLRLKKNETLQDKIDEVRKGIVDSAPNFTLKMLNGEARNVNTRGGKIIVLYLWSPRSTLSQLLFSDLQLLHAKYRARGVELYALDTDSALATVKNSPAEFGYSFDFATVDNQTLSNYKAVFLPSAMLIKEGVIISRYSGYEREFVSRLEADLKQFFETENFKPKKRK